MGGKQSTSIEKYYTGEFNCSVSLFNRETGQYEELREAQDYLLEIEPFAFEIMSDFIEKHVVTFINRHLEATTSKEELLLGYGFGGDHGDGNGNFCVPFKLTEIPPMYFEMVHTKRNLFKLKKPLLPLYGKESKDDDLSKFVMNFSVELKEKDE
jgi:hypothetical protein